MGEPTLKKKKYCDFKLRVSRLEQLCGLPSDLPTTFVFRTTKPYLSWALLAAQVPRDNCDASGHCWPALALVELFLSVTLTHILDLLFFSLCIILRSSFCS